MRCGIVSIDMNSVGQQAASLALLWFAAVVWLLLVARWATNPARPSPNPRRRPRLAAWPPRRYSALGSRWPATGPSARCYSGSARLVRASQPGKVSLAGAYAFGYGAIGLAQQEGDQPGWWDGMDPLDALFLGTVWPQRLRDGYEFGNVRSAWLAALRDTMHWAGIERFVREVITASEEHGLPVDDGELMLLLAGRLEAAGLDQRKLPRHLLSGTLLDGSRAALGGPPAEFALPGPPPDAAELVARLWAGIDMPVDHGGTAADALREGLGMLARTGIDVRAEMVTLLPALYAALVADEDEELPEAAERAVAWVAGLPADSPLIPVADVLLAAPHLRLDPDAALGHLFGIPAFTQPVRPQDRRWHSWPGTELPDLAFEFGFRQVVTRDSKIVRIDPDATAALEAQIRRFEDKFGRPPGPHDPIFFDPDADEPRPITATGMETATVAMLEAAGISPAWIYAYQNTGGLLPGPDGTFATAADHAEWDEAVTRYTRLHQPGQPPDHEAETARLRGALTAMSLQMAADDPGYGASLATRLTQASTADDRDTAMLREFLHAAAGDLQRGLAARPGVRAAACEHARAWAGADLAAKLREELPPAGDPAADAALLAVAVAVLKHPAA